MGSSIRARATAPSARSRPRSSRRAVGRLRRRRATASASECCGCRNARRSAVRLRYRPWRSAPAQASGGGFELRRHRAAGTAPVGPEIDDDRQSGAADIGIEVRVIERERRSFKQRRLAARADRAIAQTFAGNEFGGAALRTHDMHGLALGRMSGSRSGWRRRIQVRAVPTAMRPICVRSTGKVLREGASDPDSRLHRGRQTAAPLSRPRPGRHPAGTDLRDWPRAGAPVRARSDSRRTAQPAVRPAAGRAGCRCRSRHTGRSRRRPDAAAQRRARPVRPFRDR